MFKRIKLLVLLFMLGVLTLSVGCGSKSVEEPTQSKDTVPSSSGLIYKFTDMDKVNVKKDVVYKSYNNKHLKLDVYYPLGNKDISKTPTVVLIHGVAPDESLKDDFVYRTWGQKIAASGFTAVTFNWRPSLDSNDVQDLIKYIRENAKDLNINSENISVIAFSAGVSAGVEDAIQVNTGFIKTVSAYYGFVDESILTINTNVKLPSFLIAMAANDTDFPPNMNDSFITKAKKAGCSVIKMVHPSAGHGFDAFNASNDDTKNIIDKTLKFIDDNSK